VGRDVVIAYVADRNAGEKIPFEPDYMGSETYPTLGTFEMISNSKWLLENTRMIVPFFSYEGLTWAGRYPRMIYFSPMLESNSFHVLGRYLPPDMGDRDAVILNERLLLKTENDERVALATLVHELVHAQGGVFLGWPSESLESATVAGTMEVLASMCNYGDDLACASFWDETNGLAMTSLRVNLAEHKLSFIYDAYARLFRNDKQQRSYEKSMRYWAGNQDALIEILGKYGRGPWIDHIIPGVCGKPMNTLKLMPTERPGEFAVLGVVFDDTQAVLGHLVRLMYLTCS
jgi:hypothetical protein